MAKTRRDDDGCREGWEKKRSLSPDERAMWAAAAARLQVLVAIKTYKQKSIDTVLPLARAARRTAAETLLSPCVPSEARPYLMESRLPPSRRSSPVRNPSPRSVGSLPFPPLAATTYASSQPEKKRQHIHVSTNEAPEDYFRLTADPARRRSNAFWLPLDLLQPLPNRPQPHIHHHSGHLIISRSDLPQITGP